MPVKILLLAATSKKNTCHIAIKKNFLTAIKMNALNTVGTSRVRRDRREYRYRIDSTDTKAASISISLDPVIS